MAGFIVDDAGNAATTDVSDATSITYTETSTDGDPSIVKLYSTSDDVDDESNDATEDSVATSMAPQGDGFNVTAEMSETVLAGSSISVAFGTGTSVVLTAAQNGTLMTNFLLVVAGQTTTDLAVTGVEVEEPCL